jgi:hypothetical protein
MSGIMHMVLGGKGAPADFLLTISTNQTNLNLRTLAVSSGWDQSTKVKATINSGVYISSNSTGTPALTVSGSFPGGVELVNNGFIYGMGGTGANGGASDAYGGQNGGSGGAGGLALSVSSAITITNNGTIGGGGGGGGGGRGNQSASGGGGGGGISSVAANSSGGSAGVNYSGTYGYAGSAGTSTAAGSGGSGGYWYSSDPYFGSTYIAIGGSGGAGGSRGAAGSAGSGGYGGRSNGSGGSGGGAVSGNSNITWVATGTRNGSIT